MAQDSTRPSPLSAKQKYWANVAAADDAERKANNRRMVYRAWLAGRQPDASSEWLDQECSKDHQFKSFVAVQQFHVRQAQMYGLGAILEALSSRG
jgi:hypothetical protein